MASKKSSGPARSAPKGRPTPPRGARRDGRATLSSRAQWAIVVVVGLLVIGFVLWLGRDVQSNLGAPGPRPAPAPAVAAPAPDPTADR
ncbi:hypothetical protein [Ilumatobacter sp.]|uniref:hypothetical protein n=1 Tax=Ilumatobacter sp. TaxID=1967498 RepID=UPI003B518800